MLRVFFFFKQKTAYEMRISDWSSDVCSSDLAARGLALARWKPRLVDARGGGRGPGGLVGGDDNDLGLVVGDGGQQLAVFGLRKGEFGVGQKVAERKIGRAHV